MLAVSRAQNPECTHVEGDMRTVRLGRRFDAVFVHDAVVYMATEADLRRAMETAFVHCEPGGAALFTPDHVRAFHRRHLTRANALVAVSGDATEDEAHRIAARLLEGLPEGEAIADPTPEPPVRPVPGHRNGAAGVPRRRGIPAGHQRHVAAGIDRDDHPAAGFVAVPSSPCLMR